MESKFKHIKKEDRKTILLLSDDLRMHSGIATMSREFVVGTAHHFNWFQLGAAIKHPETGKTLDVSEDINKNRNLKDANVKILPWNGYGDADIVRKLIEDVKPDAIMIFTDPRYWVWLFEIEREIRTKIPIFWLNIWDDYPAPVYNKNFYNSVDCLMAISKQTKNINELVLDEDAKNKVIKYVPHGIDHKVFFPITQEHDDYDALQDFKKNLFPGKEIDFVLFFNSRNIQRKRPGDTILAYRLFCDMIGHEAASRCVLLMHTAPSDQHGTDLRAVKEALSYGPDFNVYFSQDKLSPVEMNLLYNVADATTLLSSNEGWGLSLTESMMAGTMIIPNVTGGMQDQCRFENEKGEWIDFDADFPSNHRGTYKKHGNWAMPVFPTNISLAGSPATPYIFDDRCSPEDAAEAIKKVYELPKHVRIQYGLEGREWAISDEAMMSATKMCDNIIEGIQEGFDKFVPRTKFDIFKIGERPRKQVKHKLIGY